MGFKAIDGPYMTNSLIPKIPELWNLCVSLHHELEQISTIMVYHINNKERIKLSIDNVG